MKSTRKNQNCNTCSNICRFNYEVPDTFEFEQLLNVETIEKILAKSSNADDSFDIYIFTS